MLARYDVRSSDSDGDVVTSFRTSLVNDAFSITALKEQKSFSSLLEHKHDATAVSAAAAAAQCTHRASVVHDM